MKTAHKSSKTSKQPRVAECKFIDRNLKAVNPKTEQFEPTDAVPIRQHVRMAGAG